MKSILISIRPEWVAKILNGEKTIEVRKTAPKCDLPIDVYIYCTKSNKYLLDYEFEKDDCNFFVWDMESHHYPFKGESDHCFNGKVVAKFTLSKLERFVQGLNEAEYEHLPNFALKDYDYYGLEDLMEKACLNDEELAKYAPDLSFYAWHISDLVIFDRPKELSEFDYTYPNGIVCIGPCAFKGTKYPPRSWCYVEEKE